jgi:transcription-repair coupling factor (superfamily II helicase)
MEIKKLEELMLFMNAKLMFYNHIIESGWRSNANTIFINNANNFGLSDPSNEAEAIKKAFCYFICPPFSHDGCDYSGIEQLKVNWEADLILLWKTLRFVVPRFMGGEQRIYQWNRFWYLPKNIEQAIEELKETEFKDLIRLRMIWNKDM